MFNRRASLFFCIKILSEVPYSKSCISRVHTKHCERFRSYQASVLCLPVATYFLSSLPCDDSTKAVNKPISVDFASVFDMLALSAVLILFIVCVCVLLVFLLSGNDLTSKSTIKSG